MKKVLIMLFAFAMTLSLIGCGAEKKVEEAITEKILEGASGADVDIDGDVVTVKGPDGEEVTVGSTQWPKSELAQEVPELKKGNVTTVMESKDVVMVYMEQVKEKDFVEYLVDIKSNFVEDAYETRSDGIISYMAVNEKGIAVYLTYVSEGEEFSVNITKQEE